MYLLPPAIRKCAVFKHMEEALRVWERGILREVYGPKRDTNGWRIYKNK
jgi:hypothetical protein